MRIGGLIFGEWHNPEQWAQAALDAGYSAVYFPVDYRAPLSEIDGYCAAAQAADLMIAEVGVWNNVLDPDEKVRAAAMERAIRQLELADYVKANTCVNIAGTYNPDHWDGHHPMNMTQRGFDDIVESCRKIVDAVNPKYTVYSLEAMPWMYPDTPKSALDIIKAVDRKGFGAHLDIVNVICSPNLYYHNSEYIKEWFDTLGPYIRSCHAKDSIMSQDLTLHLSECRPGTGNIDYEMYLKCASELPDDIPVMLEHMTEREDYVLATAFLKETASRIGIKL